MNINRSIPVRIAVVATAFAIVTGTASPALAEHSHRDVHFPTAASFGTPLVALGGLSMAQYLQRHQAGDARTAVVA
jgi:hypothetical protein